MTERLNQSAMPNHVLSHPNREGKSPVKMVSIITHGIRALTVAVCSSLGLMMTGGCDGLGLEERFGLVERVGLEPDADICEYCRVANCLK